MRKSMAWVVGLCFAVAMLVVPAHADTTLNFTGTCAKDCSGTATATLVVDGSNNFVSFDYHSDLFDLTVGPADLNSPWTAPSWVITPPGTPTFETFDLLWSKEFTTDTQGNWCLTTAGIPCFKGGSDSGYNGAWSGVSVPEPSSLILFGTGLTSLAAMMRRRLRK